MDSPGSHFSESHQPDILSHHDHRNPIPTEISEEKFKALVENGKLMYAYLQRTFDLPASKIQGPKDDDHVRHWYYNHKEDLGSQGWVPGEPSETKADILQKVLWPALKGTKFKPNPSYFPVLDRWSSITWEKQVSCLVTF